MKFKIKSTGEIILADLAFMEAHHAADYEAVPEPEAATPTVRRMSKLDYMNRFEDAELGAIYSAAKVNVAVEVWLAKFNAATPDADGTCIDLDDPRTVAGLQGMEAAGLLAPGRAAEILT